MFGFFLIPLVILIILLYHFSRDRKENQLPGPQAKMFIGVLPEIKFETFHHTLYEWSLKYGDIFQFHVMGATFVSLNSSAALRDAFQKEPNVTITSARPPTFSGKYLRENYSGLAFASYSDKWAKQRKLHHEVLHAYGEGLKYIENQIQLNLRQLKIELIAFNSREQDPADFIEEFILNVIEIMLIGRSFGRSGELQKLMKKCNDLNNEIAKPVTDFFYMTFPFLRFLPLPMSKVIDEFIKSKQRLMNLVISYTENEENENHGIISDMKKAVNDNKILDNPWFTEDNMTESAFDLIAAAYLTTRGSLVSLVQLLAKRPTLQQKLQQEIDRFVGPDREPSLSDRQKCPLTEAVIFETLRYVSHTPLSIFHQTAKPCTIQGYRIEKGVTIIPNLWTIHHSEKYWGDPFNFRPDRFLDSEGHLLPLTSPERRGLHSFGLGKRSCVGEVFARSRMFLFLATLMQTFTIHEPDSESLPDLLPNDMTPGIVLQPRPYKVKFIKRSHAE